jgi:hypothetical protein
VVTEHQPYLAVKVGANGTTVCWVILTGRATSVPFTAVMTGQAQVPL